MIARCKHRKPGDGGIVDGCGWQGQRPSGGKCPGCGVVGLLRGGEPNPTKDWAAAGVVLGLLVLLALLARLAFSAWREERDHAEFLFDCCHHQTPEECENVWLSQYAVRPD